MGLMLLGAEWGGVEFVGKAPMIHFRHTCSLPRSWRRRRRKSSIGYACKFFCRLIKSGCEGGRCVRNDTLSMLKGRLVFGTIPPVPVQTWHQKQGPGSSLNLHPQPAARLLKCLCVYSEVGHPAFKGASSLVSGLGFWFQSRPPPICTEAVVLAYFVVGFLQKLFWDSFWVL